jgi:hypothetical protein
VKIIDMEVFEIFIALLTTILAIAGLIGGLIYKVIIKRVEELSTAVKEDVRSLAKVQHHIALATVHLLGGYACWRDYRDMKRKGKKKKIEKLNLAIARVREAYDLHANHLYDQEPENEKLICWVKNDLAYYLAERQRYGAALTGDDALAQQLAKYCYDRICKYPEKGEAYADTYQFVQKQFNNKQ